jgi:hypothetical protein
MCTVAALVSDIQIISPFFHLFPGLDSMLLVTIDSLAVIDFVEHGFALFSIGMLSIKSHFYPLVSICPGEI